MSDFWVVVWVLAFVGMASYILGEATRLKVLYILGLALTSWAFLLACGWFLWMAFWF